MILVLNSGSSSVKFAVLAPDSGERALTGEAEKVGTAEATLTIQRDGHDPATERLADGTYHDVISRILHHLTDAGLRHPAAAGHRLHRIGEQVGEHLVQLRRVAGGDQRLRG